MGESRSLERVSISREGAGLINKILIFVQDPGATNYVAPLYADMKSRNMEPIFLTDGLSGGILDSRGIPHEPLIQGDSAETIVARYSPRVIVVGTACNPDTFAFRLIQAARVAGIPIVGVVDAAMNPEFRFCGRTSDPLAYAPDWLLVPDSLVRDDFVKLGFPSSNIAICGHPHYDYVRELSQQFEKIEKNELRTRLFPGVKKNQKIIIFVSEASCRIAHLLPEDFKEYTFLGRGSVAGRTEIILEEFLDTIKILQYRPYIVLRAHPKDTDNDYDRYREEIDIISRGGSPLEMLFAADLVVGMTSMSLLEAALMGRPVLAIIPRPAEMSWLPGVRSGALKSVQSREGLRDYVRTLDMDRWDTNDSRDGIVLFGSVRLALDVFESLICRA